MAHILITFLGKGRKEQGGYQKTSYRFDSGTIRTTPFFGLALLEELSARDKIVEHLVVMGTSSSIWDALLLDEMHDSPDRWEQLADQVSQGRVEQNLLTEIAPEVAKSFAVRDLAGKVTLCIIPFGRDQQEQVAILQVMAEIVGEGDTVSMDISHGFRSLPMLGFASALFLRQIKKAKIAGLYYGALEMREQEISPVIRLDGLLKIADWVSAVSAFRVSGDYGVFSSLLSTPEDASSLHQAGFLEKTLNIQDARSHLKKVRNRLPLLSENDPVFKLFAGELQQATDWVDKNTFPERQLNAARNAVHNGNYARAAALGIEAIISAQVIRNGQNPEIFQNKNTARTELQDNPTPAFSELNILRNSLAHGTRPKKNIYGQQTTLANGDKLQARLLYLLNDIQSMITG
jgi:CRISPR-associated Csx2 family protein